MTILPLSTRIASGLGKLLNTAKRRKVYHHLSRFDDHLLRDIGVTRLDLEDLRKAW
jgi:uncharacterized protein YjiS (DUF1127 family)